MKRIKRRVIYEYMISILVLCIFGGGLYLGVLYPDVMIIILLVGLALCMGWLIVEVIREVIFNW